MFAEKYKTVSVTDKVLAAASVSLLLSAVLNSVAQGGVTWLLYLIGLYIVLGANLIGANGNPFASVYSLGTLLYYYQVPLIYWWKDSHIESYSVTLTGEELKIYYLLYAVVVLANVGITRLILWFDLDPDTIRASFNKRTLEIALIFSTVMTVGMLLYAFNNAGGMNEYLALDKFESITYAKIGFFTWKDFLLITMALYFLVGKRNLIFLAIILGGMTIEVLTAKRLTLMLFAVLFYVFIMRRQSIVNFALLIVGLLGMNLLKFTYYNLKLMAIDNLPLSRLFWFDWPDFFKDSLLIGEFHGHVRLTYLFIFEELFYPASTFIDQFLVALPLGHRLVPGFQSVGKIMQVHMGEKWAALGANMYLPGYVSVSYLGVLLTYLIFAVYLIIFVRTANHISFARFLFIVLCPFLLFYSQREQIILIFKNLYVLGAASAFVWAVSVLAVRVHTELSKPNKTPKPSSLIEGTGHDDIDDKS